MRNQIVSGQSVRVLMISCIVLGVISGAVIGFYYLKSRIAALISAVMGIVIGSIAGGLAMVRAEHFYEIAAIGFGGCWLLAVTMLIAARNRAESSA